MDRDRHQLTLREFDDANQIMTVKHRLIFEEKERWQFHLYVDESRILIKSQERRLDHPNLFTKPEKFIHVLATETLDRKRTIDI